VTLALSAFASPVRAQVTEAPKAELFPDPSKFAYGVHTEGELGAVILLGDVHSHLTPGWALGLTVGYDLLRWLAIEARGIGSTHTTSFSGRPQDGELLQLYQLLGALRVTIHYRHLGFFADGVGGLAYTSTNLLAISGLNERRLSPAFGGGLGLDYHTLSRHFSFGVHGTGVLVPGLANSLALVTTAYVRYAF